MKVSKYKQKTQKAGRYHNHARERHVVRANRAANNTISLEFGITNQVIEHAWVCQMMIPPVYRKILRGASLSYAAASANPVSQFRLYKRHKRTLQHGVWIRGCKFSAMIFYHLVRVQHIGSNLIAPCGFRELPA